jgi:predicted dehydrogenase
MSSPISAPIPVGIIGCGAVAQQMYTRTLPRVPGVRVSCVTDRNEAAARTLAGIFAARACSLEDVLAGSEVVIIATPPGTHYALCKQALEAGVGVVCEKPFVGTTREAGDLVEAARRRNLGLYVGHFRRTYPAVQAARRLIATGALGAVKAISVAEGGRYSWGVQSGYIKSDPLGGVLFDTGSHAIDMALYACALDHLPLAVEATVHRDRSEPAHEVKASGVLVMGQRRIGFELLLSRYEALANRVRIELEHARVDLPTGLRSAVRVTGKHGSTIVPAREADASYFESFTAQWEAIFADGGGAETFEASRFLGLTAVLEGLAR